MSLIRWKPKCCKPKYKDPFHEFFGPQFGLTLFPEFEKDFLATDWPAIDISEDKDNVQIKADLPGLKREDISLSTEGSVLTIRGERKSEEEKKDKNYHRVERSYGSFQRSVDVGTHVDQSKVKAKYKDGVLEISIPKSEETKSNQIDIEST